MTPTPKKFVVEARKLAIDLDKNICVCDCLGCKTSSCHACSADKTPPWKRWDMCFENDDNTIRDIALALQAAYALGQEKNANCLCGGGQVCLLHLPIVERAEATGRLAGLEVINTAIEEAHRVLRTCERDGNETQIDRWRERLICLEGLAQAIRQRQTPQRSSK